MLLAAGCFAVLLLYLLIGVVVVACAAHFAGYFFWRHEKTVGVLLWPFVLFAILLGASAAGLDQVTQYFIDRFDGKRR